MTRKRITDTSPVSFTYPDVTLSANQRLRRGTVHLQVELPVSRQREGTGLKLVCRSLVEKARVDVGWLVFLGPELSTAPLRRVVGSNLVELSSSEGKYLVELIVLRVSLSVQTLQESYGRENREHICRLNMSISDIS
jgi:hypothetical protein